MKLENVGIKGIGSYVPIQEIPNKNINNVPLSAEGTIIVGVWMTAAIPKSQPEITLDQTVGRLEHLVSTNHGLIFIFIKLVLLRIG